MGWVVRVDLAASGASPPCSPTPGKQVIGVDLLGHGAAPKPHDPAAYADLTAGSSPPFRTVRSARSGSRSGDHAAARCPASRFRRVVVAGIGRNVFGATTAHGRILAGIEGTAERLSEPG